MWGVRGTGAHRPTHRAKLSAVAESLGPRWLSHDNAGGWGGGKGK